jgi:hypothetical protein
MLPLVRDVRAFFLTIRGCYCRFAGTPLPTASRAGVTTERRLAVDTLHVSPSALTSELLQDVARVLEEDSAAVNVYVG